MSRPVILISPDLARPGEAKHDRIQLNLEYQEQVAEAGANPLVASPFANPEELLAIADGWLVTGGYDLPGELFGQETHPAAELAHPLRPEMDSRLYAAFSTTDKPILGVCLGVQFLNVINGGTLVQHLPDVLGSDAHRDKMSRVRVEPESRLFRILGGDLEVSCHHHQAVDRVAPGWRAAALAEDGTVEAIEEISDRWRFGVQWHPERTANAAHARALFGAFVEACIIRRSMPAQPR